VKEFVMGVRNNYNLLDLGKFIASIGIVALHMSPLSNQCTIGFIHQILGFLTSLCVPYFFAVSAFLFFDRNGVSCWKGLLNFMKRISILYFLWWSIHLVITRDFLIFSNFSFSSLFQAFGGSWFYVSLVISTVLVMILARVNEWLMIIISALVYAYFIACNEGFVYNVLYTWCINHTNGWFLSFPYAIVFTAIGYILSLKNNGKIIKLIVIDSLIVILFIIAGETLFWDAITWIGRLITIEILMIFTISPIFSVNLPYRSLRALSVLIFMTHFYYFMSIHSSMAIGCLNLDFVFVLLLSILTSLTLLWLSKRSYGKIIKYLY